MSHSRSLYIRLIWPGTGLRISHIRSSSIAIDPDNISIILEHTSIWQKSINLQNTLPSIDPLPAFVSHSLHSRRVARRTALPRSESPAVWPTLAGRHSARETLRDFQQFCSDSADETKMIVLCTAANRGGATWLRQTPGRRYPRHLLCRVQRHLPATRMLHAVWLQSPSPGHRGQSILLKL